MPADSTVLRKRLGERYAGAHRNAVVRLRLDLKAAAPYDRGELRQSIGQRPTVRTSTSLSTVLEATADQASWTNDGTRPHVIKPRGPGYPLKFFWPKVGTVVRFMQVNHPGNRGTKWWDKTLTGPAYRRHLRAALAASRQ